MRLQGHFNDKGRTSSAVTDKSGNLITEDTARKKRWREHFEGVLNRPIPDNPVSDNVINDSDNVLEEISTVHISKAEIRAAINRLKIENQVERMKLRPNC